MIVGFVLLDAKSPQKVLLKDKRLIQIGGKKIMNIMGQLTQKIFHKLKITYAHRNRECGWNLVIFFFLSRDAQLRMAFWVVTFF